MKKIFTMFIGVVVAASAQSEVILASTTSTQNSGLYKHLVPLIEEHINDKLKIVAVGTGQALKLAENGDADLLIVHAPQKEKAFLENGYGIDRRPVMYNHFVVVGPQKDPAGVKQSQTAIDAFIRINKSGHDGKAQFVSRGDNSGTYFKEQSIWKAADKKNEGEWYLESGSGMGATLNIAIASNAYTLSDSSTWLNFGNKSDLVSLFSSDPVLFNQYSVILIPKERYPHVQYKKAKAIADWLTSDVGQNAINTYAIKGKQAFVANAGSVNKANNEAEGTNENSGKKTSAE